MRHSRRFQLTLRTLFIAVSTASLCLGLLSALDYDFHRFIAVASVSTVIVFLAYQGMQLLLDLCRDLTDFINGKDPPS